MNYTKKQYLAKLTKNQQLDIMGVDFFSDKELKTTTVENGYVLPPILNNNIDSWRIGGVANSEKEFVKQSGQYAFGERDRVKDVYDFNEKEVDYIDEEVIYMNYFIPQWGHYLLDVIGRLWYVLKNNNKKIVYSYKLNENDERIENSYLELLHYLGIKDENIIFVNKVTKFKKIIIPDVSICLTDFYTKEYKQMIDTIVNKVLEGYTLKQNRKIYCSRGHFESIKKKVNGENEIEKIFSNNGYEIVYMEELSLCDQIRTLNECSEIVCITGTLVHNAIFIKNPNCHFTILNKTYKINPNIYLTNQLSECSFTFVDSYLSPLPVSIGKGPFMMTVTKELLEYLKDCNFKVKNINYKINNKDIINYYIEYIKKYKKRIFKMNKISTTGFSKYDVTYKEIRKNYRKQLRIINK